MVVIDLLIKSNSKGAGQIEWAESGWEVMSDMLQIFLGRIGCERK